MNAEQLPGVGSSREQLSMDFKMQVDVSHGFELAKDVAAFSNASGGVILVGAAEAQGKLGTYKPMTADVAGAIRAAYSKAVSDRCSPAPLFDSTAIPLDDGFIVAVSVWPFPTQPVGVRVAANKQDEAYGGPAWVFPLRTGIDTSLIRPEQLPMLMVPELRRIAILLDMIPPTRRRDIDVLMRLGVLPDDRWNTKLTKLDFVEVRLLENVAIFRGASGNWPTSHCHIPLGCIDSVWSTVKGTWRIALRGFVRADDEQDLLFESVE